MVIEQEPTRTETRAYLAPVVEGEDEVGLFAVIREGTQAYYRGVALWELLPSGSVHKKELASALDVAQTQGFIACANVSTEMILPHSTDSPESLISAMRAGNLVYDSIILTYWPFAIAVSRGFHQQGLDSDDLASIAVVGLYKAAATYDLTRCSFAGYAGSVVRNCILDAIRKEQVLRNHSCELTDAHISNMVFAPYDCRWAEDPEAAVIEQEERQMLRDHISRLPRGEQVVIALRYAERCSAKETAARTGRSVSGVHAVRRRIVHDLQEEFARGCVPSEYLVASPRGEKEFDVGSELKRTA